MTVAALLLAAGQSRRFGPQDKLLADLDGTPLVVHAARALSCTAIKLRLAVVTSPAVGTLLKDQGFATLTLPPGPQSASIVAGVEALRRQGARRIVIALGDMPRLQPDDISDLLAMPPDNPASAWLDEAPCPPAVFPESWFSRLTLLTGDRGAGILLRDLPTSSRLAIPAARLLDVDVPEACRPTASSAS